RLFESDIFIEIFKAKLLDFSLRNRKDLTLKIMKFLVLIVVFFLSNNLCAQGYPSACQSDMVFAKTDTPPESIHSISKMKRIINNKIMLPEKYAKKSGKLALEFVINCKGETGDYSVVNFNDFGGNKIRNELDVIAPDVISILKESILWSAGEQ